MTCSKNKRFLDILQEGAREPGDCGRPGDEEPLWLDKKKLLRIGDIYSAHCPGIMIGHFLGQMMMSQVPSLVSVIVHTGNHSTKELATKRAVMTLGFFKDWYKGRLWDPQDPAHRLLCTVRAMHKTVFRKVSRDLPRTNQNFPWMSQYDMVLTQFALFAPLVIYGDKVGLHCSRDELDCLIHFWRYVGYLLGIEDKYNLCGLEYEELVEVCQDFSNPTEEFVAVGRTGIQGYSYLLPFIDYDSVANMTCDVLGITALGRKLDWGSYFTSWYYWLSVRMLKFHYVRQLVTPLFQRRLEHRISRYRQFQS